MAGRRVEQEDTEHLLGGTLMGAIVDGGGPEPWDSDEFYKEKDGATTAWVDEDEDYYSKVKKKKEPAIEAYKRMFEEKTEPEWMEDKPLIKGGRLLKAPVLVGFRYWPKDGKPIYYISKLHPLYEYTLEHPSTTTSPEERVTCDHIDEIGGGKKEHWLSTNHYHREEDYWGQLMFRGEDCDNFFFRQDYEEPLPKAKGVVGEDIDVPELIR